MHAVAVSLAIKALPQHEPRWWWWLRIDLKSRVPGAGVEPARLLGLRFLRPLRLPLRHPGFRDSSGDLGQVTAPGPVLVASGSSCSSYR
jgi:hypothetical protein